MKLEFQGARKHTEETLDKLRVQHHMFYQPTTESYWDQHIKLLAINLEPYGYEDSERYSVDRDDLIDWMYDSGHTRARTTRNTIAASKVILDGFYKRQVPSPEYLHKSYYNEYGLEKTLDRMCYYNIRPISNSIKLEDLSRGKSDYQGEIAECINQEILALNPDVIMVSGKLATHAVSKMLCCEDPLPYLGARNCAGVKIISVRHFSRPSYAPLTESIYKVVDYLITNKPLQF